MGIVAALQAHVPHWFGHVLRVYVGLTGALVLLAAATTSISGFGRLAYSLGEHGQLPRAFGRLHRRTLVAPASVFAASAIAIGLIVGTSFLTHEVTFLASLFSFGVLLAFTAAQLAVIKLRVAQPELRAALPRAARDPRARRDDPAPVRRRRARHVRRLRGGDGRRTSAPATAARPGCSAASSSTCSSAAAAAPGCSSTSSPPASRSCPRRSSRRSSCR